jgi:hypothetical protein
MNRTTRSVAAALKQIKQAEGSKQFLDGVRRGVELSASAISGVFAQEYATFDRQKFLRSCGVPDTPVKAPAAR